MTQRQGRMRQVYPDEGNAYGYRMETRQGQLVFSLEEDSAGRDTDAGTKLGIELSIETGGVYPGGVGEGLCRAELGAVHAFAWAWVGQELHLWLDGSLRVFRRADPSTAPARRRSGASAGEGGGEILAPMPGAILEVLVAPGDRVERNQTVVVMESMKMELVITASRSGVVRRVAVEAGQQVDRGMRLLELAPDDDAR